MPELLEFEEPIGILLKEVEALSKLPETEQRRQDIDRLEARISQIRADIYSRLTPWQRVLVARHPSRPATLDYVERLCTDFVEIRGDRRFADDHAIIAGMARYRVVLPRPSRSICVKWRCSRFPSWSWCTAKEAAAVRSASPWATGF